MSDQDRKPEDKPQGKDAESLKMRDDVRCEAAVQSIKDILWRFEETSEGSFSLHDLLGFVVEDLIKEGCCAACIGEAVAEAFQQAGADPTVHRDDGDAVYH